MWILAWRNLWRNRGRTVIAVTAIACSLAMLLVSNGVQEDSYVKLEASALKTSGGSVLVHGDGYWQAQSGDIVLSGPDEVIAAAEGLDGVREAVPRVIVNGLLTSPRGNAAARLYGIDLEREAVLADPRRYLSEGDFFDADMDDPIVLGRGIVEQLELELGDRVVLTATDPDGEMVRALFHLSGILESGSDSVDDMLAYTTLERAQQAVGMDDAVSQVGLVLDDDEARVAVRDALEAALGSRASDLELLTWDEAMPDLVGAIRLDRAFAWIYKLIVFVIVGFGIANTFLMVVLERVRELGLLGALGLRPGRVARLIVAEALYMGAVSALGGMALGGALHLLIATKGIDMTQQFEGGYEVSGVALEDMIMRSVFVPSDWAISVLFVFIMVTISALYPAWRATRLDPAQAMRTYQ